jgi:hypothetical protein
MAPCTIDGHAHGMACGGHIHHENHGSISVDGPAPASTFGHGLDFCSGGLDPAAYNGHILGTTLRGYIPEFTYIEGPTPSLTTGHGQASHPGNWRPMAHGELTHRMALGTHNLLGNHEIVRTHGLTPFTSLYPI